MALVDIDSDNRRFVDAVTLPMEDDSSRREILVEALAVASGISADRLGEGNATAYSRLLASAPHFRLRAFVGVMVTLGIFAAFVWSAVLGLPAWRSLDEVLLVNRMTYVSGSSCCSHRGVPRLPWFKKKDSDLHSASELRVLKSLSPEARLLSTGDHSKTDRLEQWRAVHDRYPRDPAHYFAYALVYRSVNAAWPADFLVKGEELDPGNGWFRLLVGAEMARSALDTRRISKEERLAARAEERTIERPDEWYRKLVILDQARLRDAYAQIDQALRMPRFDDYRGTLNRIRFDASPSPSNFARHCYAHVLAVMQPEDGFPDWHSLRELGTVFHRAAEEAVHQRDLATLGSLQERTRLLGLRLPETGSFLIPQLTNRVLIRSTCGNLADAWAALGNPAMAGHLIEVAGMISHKRPTFGSRPPDALSEHRGSGFLSRVEAFSRHYAAAPVTESQLRGGRLAEYAVYERFIAHAAAWVLFLASAFVLIRAACEKRSMGLLPERLVGLLTLPNRARILMLGLVLPFALYVVSTRLPWMDPRESALGGARFFLWLAQALALVLAIILISLDATSRRLHRRAPQLALRWRPRDRTWAFGWLALLFIPSASLMARLHPVTHTQEMIFWSFVVFMVGMPLAWALNLAVFMFAGGKARQLHRAILLRSLVLPLALASLLVASAIPLLRAEELHWVGRIDHDALHPDHTIFSPRAEHDYAAWIGSEVRRASSRISRYPGNEFK